MTTTMRRVCVLALLCALCCVACVSASQMRVTERLPDGAYCGSHVQMVYGRVDVKRVSSTADINVTAFGSQLQCNDEAYTYDTKTHKATLTHANDPDDCIGAALTQNHLTLDITYKPASDVIVLDFGVMRIACKRC